MKKAVGLLSVFLACTIVMCSVTPVLSETIANAFSAQPQIASLIRSAGDDRYGNDRAEADEEGTSSEKGLDLKEVAYEDGRILIYNYTQLSMIGSGECFEYEDGNSAVYASDAAYRIVRDIPIPRNSVWQLPDGFKGTVTGIKQKDAPLYDKASDSIYFYNPYQLAVAASDDSDSQPVLSGDINAKSFGTGQPLTVGTDGKTLLTYSGEHNYVVSLQFCSVVTEKPVSVRTDNKSVEAVGAQTNAAVGDAADYVNGRDFAGQVLKTIGNTTYILIGTADQLKKIGTDTEVYTRVYLVKNNAIVQQNGKDVILYGGDADLAEAENGYKDFSFQSIDTAGIYGDYAGVNQSDGSLGAASDTATGSNKSWKTGVKYKIDADYIVFRDIDLGTNAGNPWTPLMFSGNMYGIKGAGTSTLWSGNALSARTTANRSKISNVYVHQTANIDVEKYIGIGFFATISNEVNTADIGLSRGTVHVENIELNQVSVQNNATAYKQSFSLVSSLLSTLGEIVGYTANVLLWTLSFGDVDLNLSDTLSDLLNARKNDPTIFATGGFAGRVVGDVDIYNCAVTGSVTVSNVKNYTGGFIGYSDGVTQYSGLSSLLGGTVNTLANLLNVVPALGLGDLVTILLGNHVLNLGQLIPTGYYEPKVRSCTVDGLTGQIGHFSGTPETPDTDYNGGFIGCQIGTQITSSEVINGSFRVVAREYGGGFSGIARDGEVKGTLTDLGVELLDASALANAISDSLDNVDNINSFQTESLLQDCRIFDCDVTVNGGANLGGFVGALAASYAIDCDIKQTEGETHTLTVSGSDDYVGGFVGTATLGWFSTLGASSASGNDSLISAVRQIGSGLLSNGSQTQSQKLLALAGLVPSAVLGVQTDVSTVNVGGKNYVGGIVGRGQGVILAESSANNLNTLTFWEQNNISSKTARTNYLKKLQAVTASGDYIGGIAGHLETINVAGLLDGTLFAGSYASFKVSMVTVEGVDAGYTVISDGTASAENNGNFVAGGFGKAFGGTIDDVKLIKLNKVEAKNNVAAGFIGAAGPGDVAGSTGLTVKLLGLNHLITVSNLLSLGQHIHVTITDSDVTGIDSGYTVEAKGSGNTNSAYRYVASGFIGQSNSTEIENCHAYKLLSVKAAAEKGYSGGFIGVSETGGLADMAGNDGGNITDLFTIENGSVVSVNGLVDAIGYLIPEYTNCTTNYVNGGYVDADVAGGFVADFESGTVDNSTIASVDNAQSPKWTHAMKKVYDPDAVYAAGENGADVNKQFAVINIDHVTGRTYGGGFGGRLRSGALAESGKGISILGNLQNVSINVNDLLSIMNTYVPFVRNAGVYSDNEGFTVTANAVRSGDPNSGSAGGFGGYMSGAQVSNCDVYKLKRTNVTPPTDLEAVSAPTYFNNQSAYAVTGGHFAGGYVGNADIGDAASVGGGLGVLGSALNLGNVATALSVVVTTVEHSDVQGAGGGFSVIADGTDSNGAVGKSGGYAGELAGAHIQNSHCKNFYYIIGQETAGGYVGDMKPGDAAKLLDNASVINTLVNVNGSLLSLVEDFVPTIRNSTTSCVPCGGAVRAQAASDSDYQRGCAGGYCGYNEGGHIWGLNTNTWQRQNDGAVGSRNFGHNTEGNYTGERHIATAWRIRSVYGQEYAGGFTGFMEAVDTASTGNINLLGGLVKASNLLSALSVVYPTEKNTAVYGPLRNLDTDTWTVWSRYIGKFGGYGLDIVQHGLSDQKSQYYYGCHVVAGRAAATDSGTYPISEGGDAGGHVGLMRSGVISNGQSYDMKLVRAMRSAGGYVGSMQTGGLADVGEAEVKLFGLDLSADLGVLVNALGEVFVPAIRSGSVRGWESGLTVVAVGAGSGNDDITYRCGFAGGYAGSAYGAQIWGNMNVGEAAGTGCNVYKLRYVRGTNAAGGHVGLATSASVAAVDTNASQRGLLHTVLNSVVSSKSDLVSVLNATLTTVYQAQVNPSENNQSDSFGFIVEGVGNTLPLYAGGFAGELEATVIGDKDGNVNEKIIVNDLRSVNARYYAGGFFGYADVKGVADVSDNDETFLVGGLLNVGEINVIEAFRPYIYYSEVNGVADGIIVRAHNEGTNSLFGETRKTGCAGGFGGAMMDGTVKHSKVTRLNTVVAPNYTGGFIGHMGKSGVVNANNAQVTQLLGATAGVFDILSTHTDNCDVFGISNGAVITAAGGSEPIAGGFAGYADVSKIDTCHVHNLKQVYSDEIAGGFVGKTDRHFLVSLEAGSPLVQLVTRVVNTLLSGLLVGELQRIDLIDLDLGVLEVELLSDGNTAYVDLLGLKIGVSLLTHDDNGNTGTALVTIGDSSVELAYTNGQIDFNDPDNAGVAVNLIKGNRTRIENSSVSGIATGYDVYGGGSSNTEDGAGAKGMAGGFVGYNKEGKLLDNTMEYCDVVRGAAELVGPFSGHTYLESVYSFNTLQSIEGENNVYSVYRNTDSTYALTSDNQTISSNPATDNGYKRFDVTHLASPVTPDENEAYNRIYGKWNGAKLSSSASGNGASLIKVYVSNKKAVLMSDTPTSANDKSLVPNPGDKKDPCEETIDLTVQKVWNDQNDRGGTRPSQIKVRLLRQAYDENGTAQGAAQVYTDAAVISGIDTTNGWFVISAADHERSDSATWTRVISGLPAVVEESGVYTYYTYSVEEAPVIGYSSAVTHHESGSTAIAKIVNTPVPFEIEFKYYDRYHDNNTYAGIQSTETTYSMTLNGIPDEFIRRDESGDAQSIDYAGLIGEKAVEFSDNALAVNNVMCDYDLWTSQSAAVQALSTSSYFYFDSSNNGEHVPYGNAQIYHTDYLGRPQTSDETKWVSYYDAGDNEVSESDANGDSYAQVRKITVWCYNYPKQYNVDIYGAAGFSDVTPKTVNGKTVFVASSTASQSQLSGDDCAKFYYNQRFGGASGDINQNNMTGIDNAGFIVNYGLPGYTGVEPSDYAAESFENNGSVYNFAYWAYDREGTQVASVERGFWYRVTTNTKLYAVYAQEGSNPGISISADTNDTYVDQNGTSRTRLNILASVFGAPSYDRKVQKLSFVNISLSTQIRDNPALYTPNKINALFEQYKEQLKAIIEEYDAQNGSKSFSSAETYDGDIDPTTGNVLNDLQLTLTTKGFIYTVTSNGNQAATGDSTILLTNKNRAHFTANYKTSALNINGTGSNGDTCLMFCGAMKYNGEWSVSTNCLIYHNGNVAVNTDSTWR